MKTLVCLLLVLTSCMTAKHPTFQSIYPLQPASSYVDFLDSNGRFISRQVTDYYVVYGDVRDKDYLQALLQEFARNHFDSTKMKMPISYELRFYRASEVADRESVAGETQGPDTNMQGVIASVFFDSNGHHQVVFNRHPISMVGQEGNPL